MSVGEGNHYQPSQHHDCANNKQQQAPLAKPNSHRCIRILRPARRATTSSPTLSACLLTLAPTTRTATPENSSQAGVWPVCRCMASLIDPPTRECFRSAQSRGLLGTVPHSDRIAIFSTSSLLEHLECQTWPAL